MGSGIVRISSDSQLEILDALGNAFASSLLKEVAALEICLVRLRAVRLALDESFMLLGRQLHGQRCGRLFRD